MDGEASLRREVSRDRGEVADHAEGNDVYADGRRGCGGNHESARMHWRRAELGLSLLLVARHDVHAAGAFECRLSTTRPRHGRIGCCGRWREVPTRCRSCMDCAASDSCRSGKLSGCRDMKDQGRCASAMLLRCRCNWIFMERCLTRFFTRSSKMGRHTEDDFRVLVLAAEASGNNLAGTGRRDLGDARGAAAIHVFKDDGVGGV